MTRMQKQIKLSERIKRGPHNDPVFMEWVVEQVELMERHLEEQGSYLVTSVNTEHLLEFPIETD